MRGYPEGGIKPQRPFQLLESPEYIDARKLANSTNAAFRSANPEWFEGKQTHKVHPVKFGGSAADPLNKRILTPQEQQVFKNFWNKFLKSSK